MTLTCDYCVYPTDHDTIGSLACAEMLYRTNLLAVVGGGSYPRFDEKAGTAVHIFIHPL